MDYSSVQAVLVFFLVLTRNTGMLLTAPIYGTGQLPPTVKIAMSMVLTVVMFPLIYASSKPIPTDIYIFALIAVKEIIVGLILGFAVDVMLVSIQVAGEYISHLIGLSIANVVDPITRQSIPVIGQFYLIMALVLFLAYNGHHWIIASVDTSYQIVPIGLDFPNIHETLGKVLALTSQMFLFALLLISPILAVMLVTEVGLGFMAKVMPQMNIFVVGLPIKIYIGFSMMIMFMPTTEKFIVNILNSVSRTIFDLIS